jgi:hypothetical protein
MNGVDPVLNGRDGLPWPVGRYTRTVSTVSGLPTNRYRATNDAWSAACFVGFIKTTTIKMTIDRRRPQSCSQSHLEAWCDRQ